MPADAHQRPPVSAGARRCHQGRHHGPMHAMTGASIGHRGAMNAVGAQQLPAMTTCIDQWVQLLRPYHIVVAAAIATPHHTSPYPTLSPRCTSPPPPASPRRIPRCRRRHRRGRGLRRGRGHRRGRGLRRGRIRGFALTSMPTIARRCRQRPPSPHRIPRRRRRNASLGGSRTRPAMRSYAHQCVSLLRRATPRSHHRPAPGRFRRACSIRAINPCVSWISAAAPSP